MSEDRFDRIELRLDRLEVGQDELRADVSELKGDVSELKGDVAELKGDVAELKGDVRRLGGRIDDLDRQMRVLHEDTVSKIAGIMELSVPSKSEMERGFAQVLEMIDVRITPLEIVVRRAIADGRL